MILIEILIILPEKFLLPSSSSVNNRMPHQTTTKKLFESPLYYSNLYDSKQKSRSHLVLFETITDKSDVGHHRGDNNDDYKHRKFCPNNTARQLEHSNAFGYLGKPFESSAIDKRQTFDVPHHRHYRQRTPTPIPFDQYSKLQTSSSAAVAAAKKRNESTAVRSALILTSDDDDDDFNNDYDYGYYDDTYDSYDDIYQQNHQNDQETSTSFDHHHHRDFMKHSNDDTFDSNIRNSYSNNKQNRIETPSTKRIVKQNELSPDNGSYFIQQPKPNQQQQLLPISSINNNHSTTTTTIATAKNLNLIRRCQEEEEEKIFNNNNNAAIGINKKQQQRQQRTSKEKLNNNYKSFSTSQIYNSKLFDCSTKPLSTKPLFGSVYHNRKKWPYNQQNQSFSITAIMSDDKQQQQNGQHHEVSLF